jgi:opacity protein-like surface antigen
MKTKKSVLAVFVALLCVPGTAFAGDWYFGGSLGYGMQDDSDNSGALTSDFTTGNGLPAIPNGTVLPSGTSVGWTTEFDAGMAFSLESGLRYDSGLRSGIELSYGSADVKTHMGVTAGGTLIDGVDAAVLTGSAAQLGATVGDVVADGRGDITTLSLFVNAYYDFNRDSNFEPYIGVGIGFSDVDVTFNPSGVGIVDDGETVLAYQVKLGATLQFNDNWEGYADYALRMTEDVEVGVDLFPATLEVENQQGLFSVGVRYRF